MGKRKSEEIKISYLVGGGLVGFVAALNDGSETFPPRDTVL